MKPLLLIFVFFLGSFPIETHKILLIGYGNYSCVNETNQSTNGFNTDTKKFIPLKILTFSYLQTAILFCILCSCLVPIYLITKEILHFQHILF